MNGLPGGFVPQALEAPLAPLDALPRMLWAGGIVNSVGRLPLRLAWLAELHAQLRAGRLQPRRWPSGRVICAFGQAMEELELAGLCEGREEAANQVIGSLLFHTDRIVDDLDDGDEGAAIARAVQAFRADWQERCGQIEALTWVFGDAGDALAHERWDTTRGLLRSTGWQELLRIRRLLEALPELARLIRRLGRDRRSDEPDEASHVRVEVLAQDLEPALRAQPRRVPGMPGRTDSVVRSGAIARMLAAEAMLLTHPRLRTVWFARHAERALLTYEDDDMPEQPVPARVPVQRPSESRRPEKRLERGPVLVCIDTSGSMRGAAEDVAKACVLEAMRAAHGCGRACYAFAFGGPGEIVERALPVDTVGIEAAIELLTRSFHGGTEISDVLDRAIARANEQTWRFADLLIATDGEFGPAKDAVRRLQAAKDELGLRVQGILIGDRETIGMLETCDDIFWVRDWRRFGQGGPSPVHSKSLTAQYFPGALRSAGTAAEVPAAIASRAVTGRAQR